MSVTFYLSSRKCLLGILRDLKSMNGASSISTGLPDLCTFCLRNLYGVLDDKSGLVDTGARVPALLKK